MTKKETLKKQLEAVMRERDLAQEAGDSTWLMQVESRQIRLEREIEAL